MDNLDYEADFKCSGETMELIPEAVLIKTGVSYMQAYSEKRAMALVSEEIRRLDKDTVCRLPFCVTVEAEALGSNFKVGDEETGPSLEGYRFKKIEELIEIKEIDLEKGRIKEVLDAVQILNQKGNITVLNVEGPFTVIALLIDSPALYRGIKNHRELVEKTLQKIEDSLVKYILAGIKKGANVISYADPTGDIGLVGPKIYRDLSGKHSYSLLKRLEGNLNNSVVHLCGRTSFAFEKMGFCTSKPVKAGENITYGEAVIKALEDPEVKFIGHKCLRTTPFIMKNSNIWKIELV